MALALSIFGWTCFGLTIVVALILDILGLFGNWLILGAVGLAYVFSGFEYFSPLTLGILTVLAVIGELLEFFLAGYGARRFGGSKGAMVAALLGCIGGAIVGTPVFPVIGTLLGACVGAFAAAAGYEYIQHEKSANDAFRTGLGAAVGKVGGLLAKFSCGLAMLAVAAWMF